MGFVNVEGLAILVEFRGSIGFMGLMGFGGFMGPVGFRGFT